MLEVEMLAAGHGDALIVRYGDNPVRRILIDGGPWFAYEGDWGIRKRLGELRDRGETNFELLIVTHVDTDHIDGIIKLLQDPELEAIKFKDVWFNGWKHIQKGATGVLGALQGEMLGALLEEKGMRWNAHEKLGGGPVMVHADGKLPIFELEGDIRLTLVSPGPLELEELRKEWPKSLTSSGFTGPRDRDSVLAELEKRARYGPPAGVLGEKPDDKAANGSSIAVIAEHGGTVALLTGDAHAPVLERALSRYAADHGGPLEVRDFKLPHHGSFSNITKNVIKLVRTKRYLISSSSQFYGHPDENAIKLVLMHHQGGPPELVFNYRSPKTMPWYEGQDPAKYTATFATPAEWFP